MDHAINSLKPFLEYEIESVALELTTGDYKKMSDCPSYPAARALFKAMRELEKCYYGKGVFLTIDQEMAERGLTRGKGGFVLPLNNIGRKQK